MGTTFQKMFEVQREFIQLNTQVWLHKEFLTYQWWLLLVLFVAPWVLWWKLVDRKRILEILVLGFLTSIVATTLDNIGITFFLWHYSYELTPLHAQLFPINTSIIPVTFMLVYQHFKEWKKFLAVHLFLAVLYFPLGEPVFIKMGIYQIINWKPVYSVPIYILMAVLLRLLVELIVKQGRARAK